MCKESEKPRKLCWVGALKKSYFFKQKTWFWVNNKSFHQVWQQIFSMENLRNMNSQIMRNFEHKSKSYFKVILIPNAGGN